ncbi:uncharacterized protein LOC130742769 [Lotus japonicus]|nr:uncharacterized protein LOC130742769 [Lotus japonicus]
MWSAARANTVPEFNVAMDELKALNEEAWQELRQIPPAQWSRSGYSNDTCCDLQVNNMCEAFNRAILEHRDKPIITLLEGLKFYMTNRIVKQRSLMQRWTTGLCPSVQKKVEISKDYSDRWTAVWDGDIPMNEFSVFKGNDKFVVDLGLGTCACRRWQLSGIPCSHAVACMWFCNRAPEDYVNIALRRSTFMDTYSFLIRGNNGPKLWNDVPGLPITPPYMRRAVGRPRTARRKNNDEPKNPNSLRRYNKTVQCRRCGEYGHNKRTCKGKAAADREIPTGGNRNNKKRLHPEMRKHRGGGGISINEPGSSSQQPGYQAPDSQPLTQGMPRPSQSQPSQPGVAIVDEATAGAATRRGRAKGKGAATGDGAATGNEAATGRGKAKVKEPAAKGKAKEPAANAKDATGNGTKKRSYGQFKGTKK